MKNLANCTPTEFVTQTVKIKKVAQDWLNATKLIEILKTKIDYVTLPENPTDEQKIEVLKTNLELKQEQGLKNLSKIFDAALEQNPQKTLEILALCCFVEPDEVDSHPISWYMESISELVKEKAVLDFFSSLAQLAKMNTSKQ